MVDDKAATKKMMDEYWTPMWETSFTGEDCCVQSVMDGLEINRDGENKLFLTAEEKLQMQQAQTQNGGYNTKFLSVTDEGSSS